MVVAQRKAPPEYVDALRRRNFEIDDFLGKGSYGDVWRAIQKSLNRPVAVKFFDSLASRNDSDRKRFERERLLLARLDHPAIPYVLTDGVALRGKAEVPYVVMQLIKGTKLADLITKNRKLETGEALEITQQVLSAVACAHDGKIVHRDIAPDNILVKGVNAYLIDFSIGMCMDYVSGLTRATAPGEHIGRIDYASPEQRRDSSAVDERTDIYSLGVVLFEMLAGHPRINLGHLDRDLVGHSVEIRNTIKTACSPDPSKRYPTAEAFSNALKRITGRAIVVDGEPVLSFCSNVVCNDARWSERGFYRGPKIETCNDACCGSCGTPLTKSCRKCRAPLPPNLDSLVHTASKSQRDATEAHCTRCGELIFKTPLCNACGSFLMRQDMSSDTAKNGCEKCRTKSNKISLFDDDNIPF